MCPLVQSVQGKALGLFGPESVAEAVLAAKSYVRSLDRLGKAISAGHARKIRAAQDMLLKSHSAMFVCLIRSVHKDDGLTLEQLREAAEELDPWTDPGEAVQIRLFPKSSNGPGSLNFRPICVFGPLRKALQTLCADQILCLHGTEPVDFMQKGRGTEAAASHIQSLIQEGLEHFVVADVKNFYGSVRQECLESVLGIPVQVLRNCAFLAPSVSLVLPMHSLYKYDVPYDVLTGMVRKGLPQGSRTSTKIAGLLHGPVLRQIAPANRIVCHGDDIAIAAHDESEANALKNALQVAFEAHPAGPFRLRTCTVQRVDKGGLDFLKYLVTKDGHTGELRYRPAGKCIYRYYGRAVQMTDEELAEYLLQWINAFPRWEPTPEDLCSLSLGVEQIAPSQAIG
jgi:hypothetical protein